MGQRQVIRIAITAVALSAAAAARGGDAVEPPPTIAENVRPLAGENLIDANKSLRQILELLPEPSYARPKDEPVAEDPQPNDRRDQIAVKAYARGRSAFLRGDYHSAQQLLETALRHDPKSTRVLRMLGIVHLVRNNSTQAIRFLSRAVSIDPTDTEFHFLIGRTAFRPPRRQWTDAIVALGRAALNLGDNEDENVTFLLHYYLGQALLQEGRLAAAVEQFEIYLNHDPPNRTTPLYFEIEDVAEKVGLVHLEVGDALCRLGRPEEALSHYEAAVGDVAIDELQLTTRQIYAHLASGKPESAERMLIDLLSTDAQPAALALVEYVARTGGRSERFVAELRQQADQSDQVNGLTLAVAELLTPDQSKDFLLTHLNKPDTNDAIFARLVVRLGPIDPHEMTRLILQRLKRDPSAARRLVLALYVAQLSPKPILSVLDASPEEREVAPAELYLRGAALEAMGRISEAIDAYDAAFEAQPEYLAANEANVNMQLRLGRAEAALTLLDRFDDPRSARVTVIRARVLGLTGRDEQASDLLETLVNDHPSNLTYRLDLAEAQYRAKLYQEAEATLWSVLDRDPTNERAFGSLFSLAYENENPGADAGSLLRLIDRARRAIPHSLITRVWIGYFEAKRGRFDTAEAMIRSALEEDPNNQQALIFLTQVYEAADRYEELVDVLLEYAQRRPIDRVPLELFEVYMGRDSDGKMEQHIDRIVHEFSRPATNLLHVEFAYRIVRSRGQFDAAIELIDRALAAMPERTATLRYLKSSIYQISGDVSAAETELMGILQIDPDHTAANNDLGYLWADQGKNLDQALEMARKAVQARPTEGAYLDSLGWAYYKLSRYDEALDQLTKARAAEGGDNAVIIDHLGDALWRLGKTQEAIAKWKEAKEAAAQQPGADSQEMIRVRENLELKLKAIQQDAEPPVAPVAQPVPQSEPEA